MTFSGCLNPAISSGKTQNPQTHGCIRTLSKILPFLFNSISPSRMFCVRVSIWAFFNPRTWMGNLVLWNKSISTSHLVSKTHSKIHSGIAKNKGVLYVSKISAFSAESRPNSTKLLAISKQSKLFKRSTKKIFAPIFFVFSTLAFKLIAYAMDGFYHLPIIAEFLTQGLDMDIECARVRFIVSPKNVHNLFAHKGAIRVF